MARAKKQKKVSPELAAQAAKMRELVERRAAERKERDAAQAKGETVDGFHPHGAAARQIRSGRRGNR